MEGSLREPESLLAGLAENTDAFFHLAGNTGLWKKKNEAQFLDNVLGTKNAAEAALAKNCRRFICTSSVSAFGFQSGTITETTVSNAETCGLNYNKTKYLAEVEVLKIVAKGLDAVIFNPCHIMEPYDRHNWAQLLRLTYRDKLPGVPRLNRDVLSFRSRCGRTFKSAFEKGRTGERYLLGGPEAGFIDVINIINRHLDRKPLKNTSPVFCFANPCLFPGNRSGCQRK